jgi:hypothetical protein
MSSQSGQPENVGEGSVGVLVPVFNDWDAVAIMLADLDGVLVAGASERGRVHVLLVDDGSQSPLDAKLFDKRWEAFASVRVLHLARNLGHQRAICVGLAWSERHAQHEHIVVMDGDGEDAPRDVPVLLARARDHAARRAARIVFAERAKRSEAAWFRASYLAFRKLYQLLIGSHRRVGNFSVVPRAALERLMLSHEMWNHYAAAVFRMRLATDSVPCERGKRTFGQSKMSFVSLAVHGISAISVNSDVAGMRLILGSSGVLGLGLIAMIFATVIAVPMEGQMPRWVFLASSLVVVLSAQALAAAILFVLITLQNRSLSGFVPKRDALQYAGEVRVLHG